MKNELPKEITKERVSEIRQMLRDLPEEKLDSILTFLRAEAAKCGLNISR